MKVLNFDAFLTALVREFQRNAEVFEPNCTFVGMLHFDELEMYRLVVLLRRLGVSGVSDWTDIEALTVSDLYQRYVMDVVDMTLNRTLGH